MEVSLLHIEGETEVDSFEDSVLARPEDVGRLEVGVNNPGPVEDGEGGEEILGKLDCQPGREALSLVLEYNLQRGESDRAILQSDISLTCRTLSCSSSRTNKV